MDLDLQGSIERFTLPEILQLIASSRKSGTLGIQKDDSIVMIYFKEGEVIYGYGPRQTFHLGQLLKERGVLNADQLDEAIKLQAQADNSKRLGEILISKRFIDRADLELVVRTQVEELLYSLLSWQTGSFKFYEGQFPTDEEIQVRLSVENVILEGLRRLDEKNMIKETLPDLEAVYTISATQAGRPREINMQAKEWNIMALVNGRRSLEQICELSPIGREETIETLAQLSLAGIITKTDRRPEGSTVNLEKMVNRLANLFESYVTEKSVNRMTDRNITKTTLERVD
ncbi:MAG: hypothetical protein DRP47_04890 [Candidatus Zixiibacteriota bacterium]|nr:MAG: hypothetical protein DRP47_04890 [candidate division Zixibacteria bacterium]